MIWKTTPHQNIDFLPDSPFNFYSSLPFVISCPSNSELRIDSSSKRNSTPPFKAELFPSSAFFLFCLFFQFIFLLSCRSSALWRPSALNRSYLELQKNEGGFTDRISWIPAHHFWASCSSRWKGLTTFVGKSGRSFNFDQDPWSASSFPSTKHHGCIFPWHLQCTRRTRGKYSVPDEFKPLWPIQSDQILLFCVYDPDFLSAWCTFPIHPTPTPHLRSPLCCSPPWTPQSEVILRCESRPALFRFC